MEKVAVPSEGGRFARHFGRCSEYTLFEIEGTEVKNKKIIDNPGHQPGFLPRFLRDKGVDCVLASGMGRKARDIFAENGIKVITGLSGPVEEGVNNYLRDNLEPGENLCDH
ncbi:MAG: NifB/NifX family molybdenum-iron cluster-binding protein [Bacillota bacterium]